MKVGVEAMMEVNSVRRRGQMVVNQDIGSYRGWGFENIYDIDGGASRQLEAEVIWNGFFWQG